MTSSCRYIVLLMLLIISFLSYSQNIQRKKETLDYIDKYKDIAMTEMVKYKIPASITLAQGILESGNGKSKLASKGNNHFGIKCHSDWKGKTMRHDDDAPQECFRVYKNVEESYNDHSKFLKNSSRYALLFDLEITDYKGWAKGLKKAGYATSPVYASALIKLIEDYDLQQYDQMVVKNKFSRRKKSEEEQPVQKEEPVQNVKPVKETKPKKVGKNRAVVNKGPVPVLTKCPVVAMTDDHHYIRENFGVKFVLAKEGDNLTDLAKELKISKRQLIKYNNLGKKTTFCNNEVIYIGPKRHKAASDYKVHVIQQGETLSQVSRLYAVKLERLFKMNGLDENSVLQIGQEIRLR